MGLKLRDQQLVREWASDAVKDGVLASPVLSADGTTVYVNGRDQQLWALHAADGKVKWSVPLGFLAQTPPTVTPDGLIVSGGGPDAQLVAFHDAGDHADQAWRRDDVMPLSTSSLGGARSATRWLRVRRTTAAGFVVAGFQSGQRSYDQQLSTAGGHRISGRGVDRV
ncbi:PQQ enzyme repeat family protein [Mycobacterium kansasii]|uniref:PQQ enzyme repeat family protein n=1 Tax=Mycobacterium kansasii TaxID=1768 RepID=A0A1V3XS18_MYCKA|nr:PQQ enzyme repeat family protein [Mycobacterium kansasii]